MGFHRINPQVWHNWAMNEVKGESLKRVSWLSRTPRLCGANILAVGTGAAVAFSQLLKLCLVQPSGMLVKIGIAAIRCATWSYFAEQTYTDLPDVTSWLKTAQKLSFMVAAEAFSLAAAAGSLVNRKVAEKNADFQAEHGCFTKAPIKTRKTILQPEPPKSEPHKPEPHKPEPPPVLSPALLALLAECEHISPQEILKEAQSAAILASELAEKAKALCANGERESKKGATLPEIEAAINEAQRFCVEVEKAAQEAAEKADLFEKWIRWAGAKEEAKIAGTGFQQATKIWQTVAKEAAARAKTHAEQTQALVKGANARYETRKIEEVARVKKESNGMTPAALGKRAIVAICEITRCEKEAAAGLQGLQQEAKAALVPHLTEEQAAKGVTSQLTRAKEAAKEASDISLLFDRWLDWAQVMERAQAGGALKGFANKIRSLGNEAKIKAAQAAEHAKAAESAEKEFRRLIGYRLDITKFQMDAKEILVRVTKLAGDTGKLRTIAKDAAEKGELSLKPLETAAKKAKDAFKSAEFIALQAAAELSDFNSFKKHASTLVQTNKAAPADLEKQIEELHAKVVEKVAKTNSDTLEAKSFFEAVRLSHSSRKEAEELLFEAKKAAAAISQLIKKAEASAEAAITAANGGNLAQAEAAAKKIEEIFNSEAVEIQKKGFKTKFADIAHEMAKNNQTLPELVPYVDAMLQEVENAEVNSALVSAFQAVELAKDILKVFANLTEGAKAFYETAEKAKAVDEAETAVELLQNAFKNYLKLCDSETKPVLRSATARGKKYIADKTISFIDQAYALAQNALTALELLKQAQKEAKEFAATVSQCKETIQNSAPDVERLSLDEALKTLEAMRQAKSLIHEAQAAFSNHLEHLKKQLPKGASITPIETVRKTLDSFDSSEMDRAVAKAESCFATREQKVQQVLAGAPKTAAELLVVATDAQKRLGSAIWTEVEAAIEKLTTALANEQFLEAEKGFLEKALADLETHHALFQHFDLWILMAQAFEEKSSHDKGSAERIAKLKASVKDEQPLLERAKATLSSYPQMRAAAILKLVEESGNISPEKLLSMFGDVSQEAFNLQASAKAGSHEAKTMEEFAANAKKLVEKCNPWKFWSEKMSQLKMVDHLPDFEGQIGRRLGRIQTVAANLETVVKFKKSLPEEKPPSFLGRLWRRSSVPEKALPELEEVLPPTPIKKPPAKASTSGTPARGRSNSDSPAPSPYKQGWGFGGDDSS